eukprot:516599-Alexandrium_andersonii.AAC.1
MSASLVGSEMCIRDSMPTLPQTQDRPDSSRCPTASKARHRESGGPVLAVSYTHLALPTICSV